MSKYWLFFILLIPFLSFSQEMEIKGTVVDTNFMTNIYGAKAYLIHLEDSVITDYQNTDRKGEFEFKVDISTYRLFISHPNYSTKEFVFIGSEENHQFDLGEIQLDDEVWSLDEIVVYAYKDPMYYVGDTLVYLADSFATKDNAVVEDLLKQLPGIVVETDGSITSQGKQISKVYVDGDEFFGSDPTIATKNLAARSIDKVQVYEIEPEDGSIGDEKIQILDLRLKDDAKKGWFAKANAATDFQNFYEGQLMFNRFTAKTKIFAFGLGSNTLNSSISRGDAALAGVSGSGLGSNATNGHPETYRAGIFFSHKESDKFKFDGNYIFSDNRLKSRNEKSTQYLLSDTTYFSDEITNRISQQQSHELALNFDILIDSSQTLKISPKVKYNLGNNKNEKTTDYLNEESSQIRNATNNNESKSSGLGIDARILYNKYFEKPKRRLTLSDRISYSQNNSESYLNYYDYFYLLDLTDNEILQLKENETANFSNTLLAKYTEPLNEKWSLNFDYELFNNTNNQDRYSYDWDGTEYSILDSLTSNVFNTSRIQNKLGISSTFKTTKHTLTLGVRERHLLVQNDNVFTNDIIKQNEFSTLPFLTYRYRISQNSNFTTRITTNSSLPSISYLSPTRDNSNPNAVLEGNENLISNYNINANVNYSIFKRISGINFNVGGSARYTFNDFARSLSYDSLGRSVSVYENINTFNNWSLRTSATIPVFKQILKITPSFNYTNSNQNNIVNGVNNLTNTHNITPGLRLMVNHDWVEFNSNLRFTEQIGKNSVNENLNINNSIWNLNNDITVHLPWKIDIKVAGNYYNYSNLSQAFNSEFFILNSSINKRIGKYDQWEIGVEGYDLLNKNTQLSRAITANTIVDSRNDIISRYFLFRVTYMFNSTFRVKDKSQ